jgi:hypothetical protein
LLDRDDVIEYFGTQDNQYVCTPMARVMQIQDILNDLTVWGDIRPIKESEQAIMESHVSNLFEDSITLLDRCYPSFTLIYLMLNQETPRHFVMRCKASFNKEVMKFMNSKKTSKVITITPTKYAIASLYKHGYILTAQTSIKIRAVKVLLSSGEIEILLTNLYDTKLYTNKNLKFLYGLRWGIETTYYKQKNQQQMEQFSGHRVICIQQDYAAGLFVANLQSLIEKQSEDYLKKVNKKRMYCHKINRNVSWGTLKYNIVKLFLNNEPEKILKHIQVSFERNTEPIRPGRHNPRNIKMKRLHGKYQTLTNYKRAI